MSKALAAKPYMRRLNVLTFTRIGSDRVFCGFNRVFIVQKTFKPGRITSPRLIIQVRNHSHRFQKGTPLCSCDGTTESAAASSNKTLESKLASPAPSLLINEGHGTASDSPQRPVRARTQNR